VPARWNASGRHGVEGEPRRGREHSHGDPHAGRRPARREDQLERDPGEKRADVVERRGNANARNIRLRHGSFRLSQVVPHRATLEGGELQWTRWRAAAPCRAKGSSREAPASVLLLSRKQARAGDPGGLSQLVQVASVLVAALGARRLWKAAAQGIRVCIASAGRTRTDHARTSSTALPFTRRPPSMSTASANCSQGRATRSRRWASYYDVRVGERIEPFLARGQPARRSKPGLWSAPS
jgi:hypothetical protein